jgi:hypothetical protein
VASAILQAARGPEARVFLGGRDGLEGTGSPRAFGLCPIPIGRIFDADSRGIPLFTLGLTGKEIRGGACGSHDLGPSTPELIRSRPLKVTFFFSTFRVSSPEATVLKGFPLPSTEASLRDRHPK